jgi:hypothetical protein
MLACRLDCLKRFSDQAGSVPAALSLFGASHLDREGKVVHRTDGGLFGDTGNNSAVRAQIAQAEGVRRRFIALGQIDPARRAIMEEHYLSDFVSAAYILTPLLENSLRHVCYD